MQKKWESLIQILRKADQNKKCGYFLAVIFLVLYLAVGLAVYDDYSVSTDEPYERQTMWVNINYISTLLGREPMDVQALSTYDDKYYGSVMQMPAVVLEMGKNSQADIYKVRHLYTFGICLVGYAAFFMLCRRLLKSNWLSLMGTAMLALFPRFFAEQFYNIKDLVFLAVFVTGMLVTVELIESRFSWKWMIVFAFISALATVTRMPGIILFFIVLGYMWLAFLLKNVCGDSYELTWKKILPLTAGMTALFIFFFVLLLPGLWEAPVKNAVEFFVEFSDLTDGEGSLIFMGQDWNSIELPWYYIPVWLLITLPVWYLICFVLAFLAFVREIVTGIKNKKNVLSLLVFEHKYWLWSILLAALPWAAMVIVGSTLYNAWRHCYFLLAPLLVFTLLGIRKLLEHKNRIMTAAVTGLAMVGLLTQIGWICVNHPFEMVYFNRVGREYAEYFDRDYWHLSELHAYRYIAEHDDSEKITIASSGSKLFRLALSGEELKRLEFSDDQPEYYIDTYRGVVGNSVEKSGYEEWYTIEVDGFKVVSVFKKL